MLMQWLDSCSLKTSHVQSPVFVVQVEGAFSQPNGQMCAKMVGWALDVTRGSEGDLLELYCGNANFTVPLAQNFRYAACSQITHLGVI